VEGSKKNVQLPLKMLHVSERRTMASSRGAAGQHCREAGG